jgi:hypothetical protein
LIKKWICLLLVLSGIGLILYDQLGKPDSYDVRFPIVFGPYFGEPRTDVKIEGKIYSFEIDLGSSTYLACRNDVLEEIQKEPSGGFSLIDFVGNEHKVKSYVVPQVKIQNLKISDVEINELAPVLTLYSDRDPFEVNNESPGKIGRYVFESTNLFMDFHNSVMFVCSCLNDRIKDGYRIKNLIAVPFEVYPEEGIFFTVDTDLGTKKFMLDTGSTKNYIKPCVVGDRTCEEWKPGLQIYHSSKFSMGSKDFGGTDFILLKIAPIYKNCDGVIGMEFLNDHIVYLDFKKKIAHIGKSTDIISEFADES